MEPATEPVTQKQGGRGTILHLSLTRQSILWLLLGTVALTALWGSLSLELVGLLAQYQGNAEVEAARSAIPPASPARGLVPVTSPLNDKGGPWGRLEYTAISLEPPDEFIRVPEVTQPKVVWHFVEGTPGELTALFARLELTSEQRAHFQNTNDWSFSERAITMKPSAEVVWSLTPVQRQAIYAELAESTLNPMHNSPFSARAGQFNHWFRGSGLSSSALEVVRALSYQLGESVCFSDVDLALSRLPDRDEGRRLMKALFRQESLLMGLHVGSGENIDKLAAYWGPGSRAKFVRPLLESLANTTNGGTLDLAQLLPPLPRQLLNTYDLPTESGTGLERNCFWTSMNFFAVTPDDQCHELRHARARLDAEYYPIADEPQFGDVILVARHNGRIIHAAVYVADDVVFTKNGGQFRRPWVLMKLDEMTANYPSALPVKLAAFRRKQI